METREGQARGESVRYKRCSRWCKVNKARNSGVRGYAQVMEYNKKIVNASA